MIGAALFLPGNAFAEKGGQNGQLHSHKEMVQTSEKMENTAKQANIPIKTDNGKPVEKTAPVSENANQNAVKQLPSNEAPKQAVSHQPAEKTVKSLPEQAKGNGYGLSVTKKTENAVNAPGQEKKAAAQEEENGFGTERVISYDVVEHSADSAVKDKVESKKSVPRFQPKIEKSDSSIIQKVTSLEPQLPVPVEKDKTPSNKDEMPTVDQAINPTQRSNNSSSPLNDRVSMGTSTISFSDKWFEWNQYVEMKLVQPFLSRYALMNTQWVNAPPSPPPQDAPFLKTVTRS